MKTKLKRIWDAIVGAKEEMDSELPTKVFETEAGSDELKENGSYTEAEEAPKEGVEEHESCPKATRRLIRESMTQLKHFMEENRLASTVVKTLLAILIDIAINALQGRVAPQVLEVIKKVISHEQKRIFNTEDTNEADGSPVSEKIEPEKQQFMDDGLPRMINTPFITRNDFFHLADGAK